MDKTLKGKDSSVSVRNQHVTVTGLSRIIVVSPSVLLDGQLPGALMKRVSPANACRSAAEFVNT